MKCPQDSSHVEKMFTLAKSFEIVVHRIIVILGKFPILLIFVKLRMKQWKIDVICNLI